MPQLPPDLLALFAAATLAGAVNAIAGGGSLITFPLLVWLGREPLLANATNTVSLAPGAVAALTGFRRELAGIGPWVALLSIPSILGGLLGGWLLLRTPAPLFDWLVPWLLAAGTALLALADPITRLVRRRAGGTADPGDGVPPHPRWVQAITYQFLVSVYGGYFGGGMGIMMLAGLAFLGFTAIHRMIALRNVYGMWINGVAAAYFILRGRVVWSDALVLTVGQVIGALLSARMARGLRPGVVRAMVIAIGVAMSASLFLRGR